VTFPSGVLTEVDSLDRLRTGQVDGHRREWFREIKRAACEVLNHRGGPKAALREASRRMGGRVRRSVCALLWLCAAWSAASASSADSSLAGAGGVRLAAPPAAAATMTADKVIALILSRNPAMRSYRAHAHLDVRQLNFPYLHPILDGTEYYTSPGLVVSDFPHVPFYLKSVNLAQTGAYAASRFRDCYDIKLRMENDAYVLHMVPKANGRVSSVDVRVSEAGAIEHMEWHYTHSRDRIALDMSYSDIGDFNVITFEQSTIRVSHIAALANSTFDQFEFNVPVPTPTPAPPGHECDSLS